MAASRAAGGPSTRMQHLVFGVMYRLGFTPWDGHPIPERLRAAAEVPAKGRALDIGCGTGETGNGSMAQRGIHVYELRRR